jgi:hypothetical protein
MFHVGEGRCRGNLPVTGERGATKRPHRLQAEARSVTDPGSAKVSFLEKTNARRRGSFMR